METGTSQTYNHTDNTRLHCQGYTAPLNPKKTIFIKKWKEKNPIFFCAFGRLDTSKITLSRSTLLINMVSGHFMYIFTKLMYKKNV